MYFWNTAFNKMPLKSLSSDANILDQLNRLGSEACLIPMKSLGVVKLTGEDARRFIQGQSTCDVNQLSGHAGTCGAVCTPKGRMVANFRLVTRDDSIFFILPENIIEHFLVHLQKYIVFFKAELARCETFGVVYTTQNGLLERSPDMQLSEQHQLYLISEDERDQLMQDCDHPILDGRIGYAFDILHGFAHIREQTREQFLPHETGLVQIGGVSFNKGCYTGQEIIARMHYRGKLKFTPASVHITGAVPASPCASREVSGSAHLVDTVSFNDQTLAIASLPLPWCERDTITLENGSILTVIKSEY